MAKKRYISYVILFCMVSCIFAGCDTLTEKEQQADKKSQISSNSKDKIRIQFAKWSVPSARLVEEGIQQFNESNQANIHVEVLKIPLDRYTETLNMLNSSGQGPDVFEIVKEWLNSYIYNNYLADLSSFIDDDFLRAFPKWAVDLAKDPLYKNKLYSIPSTQITYRLIYNKDLYKAAGLNPELPPKTLSELKKYANSISDSQKGKRKYGFALPVGEEWMSFVQTMEAVNSYSGVYFYDFLKGKYDLTVYKPWISTIKGLNKNGGLFPGMETMKSELALAQFAEGNIGMMYAASWEASYFFDQFPPRCDWAIALPPAIDEESIGKGATQIHPSGWNVVSMKTSHLEESAKLWEFLYSKEYVGSLYKNCAAIPVADGILQDTEYISSDEHFKSYLPRKEDSVYPNTPLIMDEWLRKNVYRTTLFNDLEDKGLFDESYRLNSLLKNAIETETIDINDYYDPKFNPRSPIKP